MKKTTNFLRVLMAATITLISLAGTVSIGFAEEVPSLEITVESEIDCGQVIFSVSWAPEEADSYLFYMDFGDGDDTWMIPSDQASLEIDHTYIDQGEFELNIEVIEADFDGLSGTYAEIFVLEGPEVTITSVPFPPILIAGRDSQVDFSAEVTGGNPEYTYTWDGGGGSLISDEGGTASFAYSEAGEYTAQVTVADSCGFTDSTSLPVVVADEDDVCHPTAQKIAEAVSSLFPDRAEQEYSCEDIYTLFDNEEEENNLGFGRMWMAYRLAESIEMSWEEILAWQLDESGWGGLLQLNRFTELLEEHSIGDLVGLVMSENYTLNDVRTAVRTATRYEAEFEDALARVAERTPPGELAQFYKLASDLETESEVLDAYLSDGMTLAELKHTSKFADQVEADWTEIAEARISADSWGDLHQAYSLATDEVSPAEILAIGVQEYRKSLLDEKPADKNEGQANKEEEKDKGTGEKLAEQYSAEFGDVMNLLNGECEGDWACVRTELREQSRSMSESLSEKDHQTALQIGAKYGYDEVEVLTYHQEYCNQDWSCTRAYFRNLYMETQETGKSKK